MTTEEQICRAILEKRPIVYTYDRDHTVSGERVGNPHIVFHTTGGHQMLHIRKTGGVETEPEPLPDWRLYFMDYITVVRIQNETFAVEESFNPDYSSYAEITCMVS